MGYSAEGKGSCEPWGSALPLPTAWHTFEVSSDGGSSNTALPLPSCETLDTLHDLSSLCFSAFRCKMGIHKLTHRVVDRPEEVIHRGHFMQGIQQSKEITGGDRFSVVSGSCCHTSPPSGQREAQPAPHFTARMTEAQRCKVTMQDQDWKRGFCLGSWALCSSRRREPG